MKAGACAGSIPRKRVGQCAANRYGRVGKTRRRSEPVRRRYIEPDGWRNDVCAIPQRAEDCEHETESRNHLTEPLVTAVRRNLHEFGSEHCMGDHHTGDRAQDLRGDVGHCKLAVNVAPDRKCKCDGGIEMRARNRRKTRG